MFLGYLHSFRALAILSVVATHCIFLFEWGHIGWQYQLILSLMSNATLFFVFIAGFLFQYLSHKFEYRRFLKGKLRNVLLPFVIVSLPMIAIQALTRSGTFDPTYLHHWPTVAQNIGWSLLTGHHILVPFWFIPMIAIFYVLAPVLIWIDRDGRLYYLLPLLLAGAVCVHRPADFDHIWHSCAYYLPVYLYGMWFSHHRDRVLAWHDRWLAALLPLLAGLVWIEVVYLHRAGYIYSAAMFSTENGMVDTNALQKLLLCGVLLVILRRFGGRIDRKLRYLADGSFGIYFLHMYVITGYSHFGPGPILLGTSLWPYWLTVAAVVFLCVCFLWLAHRMRECLGRNAAGFERARRHALDAGKERSTGTACAM